MKTENWTKNNIPNLTGQTIIVTGGNTGLGKESVKAFAENGADVILACRNIQKGEDSKSEIMQGNVSGTIQVVGLDLMDLDSVRSFADHIKKNYTKLDVLLNNAGIMTTPYFKTKDGFEAQLGTNHLGHFALTVFLLDLLKKSANFRVVNVSSLAHRTGRMDFENLLFEQGGYAPMKSYGQSKLANLLFTFELQRYFQEKGIHGIAVAAHPGGSQTDLARHLETKFWFKLITPLFKMMTQSAAQGALPQIRAAVDASVKGGEYYGPDGFRELKGNPVLVKAMPHAYKVEDAKKLWQVSEKLTNVTFQTE